MFTDIIGAGSDLFGHLLMADDAPKPRLKARHSAWQDDALGADCTGARVTSERGGVA
jgi:hypothetical protein